MKNPKDIGIIIQARMSSERVPRKMLRPFVGTTILDITLEKIKQLKSVDWKSDFWLAVHEQELVDVAGKHGLNVFHRSEKSASSEGTPMGEMYEWWDKLGYKYCVLVNACAPFLSTETIDDFILQYIKSDKDGMFGVIEKKNYFWNKSGELINQWPSGEDCMNTKMVSPTYEAAHCLYAGRTDRIGEGIWMGDLRSPGEVDFFPMEERECFDIDYEWQFKYAEAIYKNGR